MVKSIFVSNNKVRVTKDNPNFSLLKMTLTMRSDDDLLVEIFDDFEDYIEFGIGIFNIIKGSMNIDEDSIEYEYVSDLPDSLFDFDNLDKNYWRDILGEGISLRDDQILACSRIFLNKRGNIQLSTGAGKSIIICAVLKHIYNSLGYYPKTLILVPTDYLVNQICDTMSSFGIESVKYNDVRGEWDGICVSHPKSINNDIDKGVIDMSSIKVILGDEAHHSGCDTWSRIFTEATKAEIVIGFSALIIEHRRLPIKKISSMNPDECKLYAVTGEIILDIGADYYIKNEILATPVVLRMKHDCFEKCVEDNWISIRKNLLESKSRNNKVIECVKYMNSNGLKTLVLINTHDHGFELLKMLYSVGLGDISICSYGSKKFFKYDGNEIVKLPKDTMDKYKTGEFSIMIGSSHIYEGVDIPNLDCVIMGVVGKSSRRIIQGIGRSLRKTKNGKYSYIIDFTDDRSGVLHYHSNLRRKMYSEFIGVPEERMFDYLSLKQLSNLITNIESNDY